MNNKKIFNKSFLPECLAGGVCCNDRNLIAVVGTPTAAAGLPLKKWLQ